MGAKTQIVQMPKVKAEKRCSQRKHLYREGHEFPTSKWLKSEKLLGYPNLLGAFLLLGCQKTQATYLKQSI